MILIGSEQQFYEPGIYELQIDDMNLLLINQDKQFYLIENKCGHFGTPLSSGKLKPKEIVCSEHGISFSLETGQIINRPFEVCDAIKTFNIAKIKGTLYLDETS